jgi:hypothetical protein
MIENNMLLPREGLLCYPWLIIPISISIAMTSPPPLDRYFEYVMRLYDLSTAIWFSHVLLITQYGFIPWRLTYKDHTDPSLSFGASFQITQHYGRLTLSYNSSSTMTQTQTNNHIHEAPSEAYATSYCLRFDSHLKKCICPLYTSDIKILQSFDSSSISDPNEGRLCWVNRNRNIQLKSSLYFFAIVSLLLLARWEELKEHKPLRQTIIKWKGPKVRRTDRNILILCE